MTRIAIATSVLAIMGCMGAANAALPGLVPVPMEVKEVQGKSFALGNGLKIGYQKSVPYTKESASVLAEYLKAGGIESNLVDRPVKHGVSFTKGDGNLGAEGYTLSVDSNRIVIRADASSGSFYGIQTLRQLLPAEATFGKTSVPSAGFPVPAVEIRDKPAYSWRGFMLDTSRHFFSTDEVKKILDLMASQKLNTFHWHITDDQGWRIEIKKYPALTEVGAWRSDIGWGLDPKSSTHYRADGKYGGFYTQDEIKDVVAYAAKLHISIVPEVDMPGHSEQAVAVMPELSCFPEEIKNNTPGIHRNVYCPGKEATFRFLEDVYSEVMDLFPGKYIHIGGDECPKDNWKKCPLCQRRMKNNNLNTEEELQSYTTKRIEAFFTAHNRTLIGWDEILEGGLAPRATVMSWRGTAGGVQAATEGHDVVMSPTSHCYFDYAGRSWQTVYGFDPSAGIPADKLGHLLGAQANLWAEYIPNDKRAEYLMVPRLSALAEVIWSPKAGRNWDSFQIRMKDQFKRYEAVGFNYRSDEPDEPQQ